MRIMQRMNSSVLQDVGTGRDNRVLVVSELSESAIAAATEKATNAMRASGVMIVINNKDGYFGSDSQRFRWSTTNGTFAALLSEQSIVIGRCDSIALPKMSGSGVGLSISSQCGVENLFHVWNEWIFRTARAIRRSIANANVGAHGSEVVLSAAVSTWAHFPCSWLSRRGIINRRVVVLIQSSPVILAMLSACFALMRFTLRVTDRYGEVIVPVLDGEAERANMFSRLKCWSRRAFKKMSLQEPFVSFGSAKLARNLGWTFHLSTLYQKVTLESNKNTKDSWAREYSVCPCN